MEFLYDATFIVTQGNWDIHRDQTLFYLEVSFTSHGTKSILCTPEVYNAAISAIMIDSETLKWSTNHSIVFGPASLNILIIAACRSASS